MKGKGKADPRRDLPESALADANTLSMPKVAVSGGDGGMAIGAAIAVGLGVLAFNQMSIARLARAEEAPQPIVIEAAAPQIIAAPKPLAPARPYETPVAPRFDDDARSVRPERLRAPTLVVDTGPSAAELEEARAAGSREGLTASEAFAARIGDAENAPATAAHIGDLSSTVIEGTLIAGVLETAINSDLPGFTRAVVSDDVRSFDGTEVLVPRGSRLIGQYRSGLAIGESRAFVVWTRLILPNGVAIKLSSPVTDGLGRAGLGGKVDRHFLERFGSAILLSIIGAGAEILASESGDSAVVITSSAQAYGVAQTALQASVNIPPTIKIAQGSPIRIFVARDLIFPLYEESGGTPVAVEP
ncbi:MAG TPA: type VI secretion protein [Parvularcula sp.]|nr:type VI secretion protein [Parvularcula sp.]HBS30717.1 type VI secretion protein [Parvularcula sp.]HBS36549.1 type VI secretion protein [Parvularcula sp.]